MTGHIQEVTNVLFAGDFIVSYSLDATLRLWDPKTGGSQALNLKFHHLHFSFAGMEIKRIISLDEGWTMAKVCCTPRKIVCALSNQIRSVYCQGI